jgi:hypothetical protein
LITGGWVEVQKKYGARTKIMETGDRTEPDTPEYEIFTCKPQMLIDNTRISTYSCKLSPEAEISGGPIHPFATVYGRRCAEYNSSIKGNFHKLTAEQLICFQHLVRMEIQYLFGCDVVWKSSGAGRAAAAAPAAAAPAAAAPRHDSVMCRDGMMSILPPPPETDSLGALASVAAAAAGPSAGPAAEKTDFSDICNWDYRSGYFPLTDKDLKQMLFPEDLVKPKHYFAAAILLYMREERTEEEEAAFQRLDSAWQHWYDGAKISYEVLAKGPPTAPPRNAYNAAEVNWCKTKMDYLDKQVTDKDARNRLGLPMKVKRLSGNETAGDARRNEAQALLHSSSSSSRGKASSPGSQSLQHSTEKVVKESPPVINSAKLDSSKVITSTEEATTPPSASRRRRRNSPQRLSGASANSDGQDEVRTCINKEGIEVSKKDGRAAANGNALKTMFPNNYRNPQNKNKFGGVALKLGEEHALLSTGMISANLRLTLPSGEAYKIACLALYGPDFPVEKSGHHETRITLFRTAAYYALTEAEEDTCRDHSGFADFLFFLMMATMQLLYAWLNAGRAHFGEHVFSVHRAAPEIQGTNETRLNLILCRCTV